MYGSPAGAGVREGVACTGAAAGAASLSVAAGADAELGAIAGAPMLIVGAAAGPSASRVRAPVQRKSPESQIPFWKGFRALRDL